MFRASLCPSSAEQNRVLLHVVFCSGCAVCGSVELGRRLCALCEGYCSNRQHNQCRTPYALAQGLVVLMMGIMMPETCWDRSWIINIRLVAFCWFSSLFALLEDFVDRKKDKLLISYEWKLGYPKCENWVKRSRDELCKTTLGCSWLDRKARDLKDISQTIKTAVKDIQRQSSKEKD